MYSRKVWVQFEIPVLTVGKFVLLIILRDSSYMSYYYMSGLLAAQVDRAPAGFDQRRHGVGCIKRVSAGNPAEDPVLCSEIYSVVTLT